MKKVKKMSKENEERLELLNTVNALRKIVEFERTVDVKKIEKFLAKLRAKNLLEELREEYKKI